MKETKDTTVEITKEEVSQTLTPTSQKEEKKSMGVQPIYLKTKYSIPNKIWLRLARIIKRKPVTIDLNKLKGGEMEQKRIKICNHNGAGGPFSFRTFRDEPFMMWGAHQMCEHYKSRRDYLRVTFYRNKLKYGKFSSFIMSWIFGGFAPFFYDAAGIIPIYYDQRIRHTLKWSVKCLENDLPVVI
ncbi:MAG: hypothetical protein FWC11_03980, partial [Firmicutes bacterium]|nr:hypothetical protein [Bacillota bacterium]